MPPKGCQLSQFVLHKLVWNVVLLHEQHVCTCGAVDVVHKLAHKASPTIEVMGADTEERGRRLPLSPALTSSMHGLGPAWPLGPLGPLGPRVWANPYFGPG